MTAEKAIKILKVAKAEIEWSAPLEYQEALDEAIEALSNQCASGEQVDQCGNDTEMVDLKKRTITERLIIAESLIDSVIADSDQFRDSAKKTDSEMNCDEWWKNYIRSRMSRDDVPDTNVGDMISRQMAIDAVLKLTYADGAYGYTDAKELVDSLEALPSAQPERKTGRWIYGEDDVAMCDGYHCSECGFFVPWDYKRKSIDFIKDYNFCPSCESPMSEEGDTQ